MKGNHSASGTQGQAPARAAAIEDAARDLMNAIADEPVSARLQVLARQLGEALDRHLSGLDDPKP